MYRPRPAPQSAEDTVGIFAYFPDAYRPDRSREPGPEQELSLEAENVILISPVRSSRLPLVCGRRIET